MTRWLVGIFAAIGRAFALVWNGMMMTPLGPLRVWATIIFGPPALAVMIWYGVVIWKGPWPLDRASQQIEALAMGQVLMGVLLLVVLVSLAGVGLNFGVSKGGVTASVGREDDPPPQPQSITLTATTEVTPATAPAAAAAKPLPKPVPGEEGEK